MKTAAVAGARSIRAKILDGRAHYEELAIGAIRRAAVSVWIATANLKTTLVEAPIGTRARAQGRYVSFFETLQDLARRGVEVRLLHASPPSGPLRAEMGRLAKEARVELRRCPRVHLKLVAIDGALLYLGSANLTGAGLGAKGDARRNFEMGIVTDDDAMLDVAQERFDRIWRGAECKGCSLRRQCDAPLDVEATTTAKAAKTAKATKRAPTTETAAEAKPATKTATSRGSSRRTCRSPSSPT